MAKELPIQGSGEPDVLPSTPEELAEALRPLVIKGGHIYRADEPDVEGARKILSGFSPPKTKSFHGTATTGFARPDESGRLTLVSSDVSKKTSNYVLGSDDRTYLSTSRTAWPYSGNARYQDHEDEDNTGWCSATMVGPHTAAIAAHCAMNTNGTAIAIVTNGFKPAYDNTLSPRAPFGTFTPYAIWVPSGWVGGNWAYDYARIDFGSATPGNVTGYFGLSFVSPGTNWSSGTLGDKGAMSAMWLSIGSITGTTSSRLKHNLDNVNGTSGSNRFIWDSSEDYYVTGIHSTSNGSCVFWSCSYWTEATRWTNSVYQYFVSIGVPW